MKRSILLATTLGTVLAVTPALAQSNSSAAPAQSASNGSAASQSQANRQTAAAQGIGELMAQLEAEGYTEINIRRTLLGRYRIEAENAAHVREIVMHQQTGEILRDVLLRVKVDAESETGVGNGTGSGSNGGASVSVGAGAEVGVEAGNGGTGGSVDGSVDADVGLGN
ncbi:hypothetical protein P1J78_03410 [Psychromarinibacter sp. C21-152]|uniref:PepSY domain-containing protein n=1 Tax=Psychromarinibacter sediminicola TaxID=3033385 RepID=A0AAE3NM03_9RHOB|nr:hypothetical protein [Psychromarinibacter sediminicola]MDF0599773.1 hypothetical protein [Psychromarinibacter sediminicola]